jgi:signal peptidase I
MRWLEGIGKRSGTPRSAPRTWCLGAALVAAVLVSPLQLGVVCGDSMSPSMTNGQFYVIARNSAGFQSIQPGDVVVFNHDGETYLKRVLAVGGDTVNLMRYGDATADDLVPDWQLEKARRLVTRRPWSDGRELIEYCVPEGHCYVVGDHLEASMDSRTFGAIPVSAIQGKVLQPPPVHPELQHFAGGFSGSVEREAESAGRGASRGS